MAMSMPCIYFFGMVSGGSVFGKFEDVKNPHA